MTTETTDITGQILERVDKFGEVMAKIVEQYGGEAKDLGLLFARMEAASIVITGVMCFIMVAIFWGVMAKRGISEEKSRKLEDIYKNELRRKSREIYDVRDKLSQRLIWLNDKIGVIPANISDKIRDDERFSESERVNLIQYLNDTVNHTTKDLLTGMDDFDVELESATNAPDSAIGFSRIRMVVGLVGMVIFAIIGTIHLFDLWAWIGLFYPEAYTMKLLMQIPVSK